MAVAQTKAAVLASRIEGLSTAAAGWLGAAQQEAAARLQAMGLPGKRDEYWRYTDPAALNAAGPLEARLFDPKDEPEAFAGIDALKIVFVDGVFDAAQSDALEMAGVSIDLLSQVGTKDIHWARDLYGKLESRGQAPVARPLATLNSAYASEGLLIRVTGKASRPISVIYLHKSECSDVILHHCIKIEAEASLTLLESGPGGSRFMKGMEVDIGMDAHFNHIRLQGRDHDRVAATHVFARLAQRSALKSFTLTANGRLTRNETVVELQGADALAHLSGAALGDGDFHHDDTVFITHAAPGCESRQVFKKVLKHGAVGVFQGKILVEQKAQKTDGYQISQSLLLDDDCQFLAKPELEIYADDVKCSHGSTSGAIDETALYYLRSRGVPLKIAQSLLVQAFLAQAIDEIEDEAIAEDVRGRLQNWLMRHDS